MPLGPWRIARCQALPLTSDSPLSLRGQIPSCHRQPRNRGSAEKVLHIHRINPRCAVGSRLPTVTTHHAGRGQMAVEEWETRSKTSETVEAVPPP